MRRDYPIWGRLHSICASPGCHDERVESTPWMKHRGWRFDSELQPGEGRAKAQGLIWRSESLILRRRMALAGQGFPGVGILV